ncbi:MAG: hypothetical protein S4CHLAM102_11710 [Chlamydiia bacterium]|nr:hypothetical protein [Chlamydiia bacterium]
MGDRLFGHAGRSRPWCISLYYLWARSLRMAKKSDPSLAQPFGALAPGRGRAQLHPKCRRQRQARLFQLTFIVLHLGGGRILLPAICAGVGRGADCRRQDASWVATDGKIGFLAGTWISDAVGRGACPWSNAPKKPVPSSLTSPNSVSLPAEEA